MVAVLEKENQKVNNETQENEDLWDKSRYVMNELDQIQTTIKVTIAAIISDNNIYNGHSRDARNLTPILEMLMDKAEKLNEYVDVNMR